MYCNSYYTVIFMYRVTCIKNIYVCIYLFYLNSSSFLLWSLFLIMSIEIDNYYIIKFDSVYDMQVIVNNTHM